MNWISFRGTKIFIFGIFGIFILVSFIPTIFMQKIVAPLAREKQEFLEDSNALSTSRIENVRLALLESMALSNTKLDLRQQWLKQSSSLLSSHKKAPLKDQEIAVRRLNSFKDYYSNVKQVGRENQGLVGQMQVEAQELEKLLDKNSSLVELLQMRRREKDFLLRKDQKYSRIYLERYQALLKTGLTPRQQEQAKLYKDLFIKTAALVEKQKSLRADYLDQARGYNDYLERAVRSHQKHDVDVLSATEKAYNKLNLINLISIVLLTSLLLFIYVYLRRENTLKLLTLEEKLRLQSGLLSHEKLAGLGTLAAGIAHEIKNPLTIIVNASEMLGIQLSEGEKQKELEHLNDKILSNAQRAAGIVQNMLDLARGGERPKVPCPLRDIILDSYNLAYQSFRARFSITIDFVPELENVENMLCAKADISQVFINLFENSFYAMKKNAESKSEAGIEYAPRLTCLLKTSPSAVSVIIRDNGIGISKEDINKILEPFFTTKPPGEGTGLGMSLVYDIIKAHNGEIDIESQPGEYTQISINFKAT